VVPAAKEVDLEAVLAELDPAADLEEPVLEEQEVRAAPALAGAAVDLAYPDLVAAPVDPVSHLYRVELIVYAIQIQVTKSRL